MDAKTIRDMISTEADHLAEKQVKERGELRDARYGDVDYQRGKIDGLRQAAELLGEGQ